MPRNKISVCFVALNAYTVLSGREDLSHTGGAEVQQLQIAKWLVERGYSVSFVTLDHGQPDGIDIDGIKVYKAYASNDGVRGLRFIHPRWLGLCSAMARANSEVYYQRCAGIETGQVALWCRLHRRKFIFASASNADSNPTILAKKPLRERILYQIGLRFTHIITVQTMTQQKLFREKMKKESFLVYNCGLDMCSKGLCQEPSNNGLRVLWVSRISKVKRLEWLLDIAECCPNIKFDVVGGAYTDSDYSTTLLQRAAKIRNVKMHGYVPHAEIYKYYQKCNILCCTSAYEGFPNTFLEAWAVGMPVVSTFDPDGVVAANGLGWIAPDVQGMAAYLGEIIKSPEIWQKASKAARQYFLANHTPEVCLPKFEKLIMTIKINRN